MTSTFISYAADDKAAARRLAKGLAELGISVWLDEDQILVGDSISERIREGILRSDYLVVLLSAQSRESSWVTREIGDAFRRFGEDAKKAILPVRIDDAPMPESLADVRYIDLSRGYDEAILELAARMERPSAAGQVASVVDPGNLANDIASERTIRRGREFYITSILALLSVVATVVSAWPAFHGVFSEGAKVYYDFQTGRVSLPPGADEEAILRALEELNVAPAGLRVRIVNRGTIAAQEVKLGSECDGSFRYARTQPAIGSKSVWVETVLLDFKPGDTEAAVLFNNLVPDKPVWVDLGFSPREAVVTLDVVADGVLAEEVRDIDTVPTWSLLRALSAPLKVLGGGVAITLFVGVMLAARRNPRLRSKLLDLLDAVVPWVGNIVRVITR